MVFRRFFQPRFLLPIRNYCENKPVLAFRRDGDNGTSKTLKGELLPKDSQIFNAIGAAEELLSLIGLANEYAREWEHDYSDKLKRIQTTIIDISAAISRSSGSSSHLLSNVYRKELETWIEEYTKKLPPEPEPEQYIIPGGGIVSASLHVARAVCRRAERNIVPLVRDGRLDREAQIYLNRLSDLLLCMSRVATKIDLRTESIYIPRPNEDVQPQ